MKKYSKYVVTLIAAIALFLFHIATVNAAEPPVPGAILATKHESTTITTHTSTTIQSLESKKVTEKIRFYEQQKNVIVSVHMRAGGVKSTKGCVDPVKKGWIKPGQSFRNTRLNGKPFTDKWEKGRKICKAKRVKKPNGSYVMRGTKDDCDNRDIEITVKGPRLKKQTKPVETYKSYKEFLTVYEKWTTSTTNTTTTPTTTVWYSCPEGFSLSGTWCIPIVGKDGQPGGGTGNGGGNGNDEPGAGDSNTVPAADCWLLDGNNDPTIKGLWDRVKQICVRI